MPAHDNPPLRDQRTRQKAPYVSVIGHPGQRSTMPPEDQIHYTKQLQGGKLTPQQSNNLSRYLASLPHPADQLHLIGTAQQEGVLPPAAVTIALGATHKLLAGAQSVSGIKSLAETNVLQSFPQLDQPTDPGIIQELRDAAKARGIKLPANPTLSDLYQGKYGPKPDGWSGLYKNLPRDFALTPVYAAQGGYALGDAVVKALPKSTPLLNAKGDRKDLREIGAQQLDMLKHPGAFAQEHPFQAALTVIGGAKLAGRAGAIGKNLIGTPLEATPRSVPLLDPDTKLPLEPVNGEVPTLNRGTLSTRNLTTRGAQQLSDAILARNPRLQQGALRAGFRDARAEGRAQLAKERAPALKEFLQARKGVTRAEALRVNENEARGITPAQHAAYRGTEDPGLPATTPEQQRYHAALLGLEHGDVARLQHMGLLSDQAATRRAYLPAIKVAAQAGDDAAQHFLELDQELPRLQEQAGKASDVPVTRLQKQLDVLRTQRDQTHQAQVDSIDKRLQRLKKVRAGKVTPGQKPKRVGTPGEIKALEQRRTDLVRNQVPFADITSAPIRKLEERLQNTPTAGQAHGALAAAHADYQAALDRFVAEHKASGAPEPLRVPENAIKRVESPFANPGGGAGIAALRRRVAPPGRYQAYHFEHGSYQPITDDAILRDRATPSRVEEAYRFAHEVSDPQRGIVKTVTVTHDQPRFEIPQGYVAQIERDASNPLANELEKASGTAPPTDPLHSLLSTFDRNKTHVEPGETVRLWPVSAYHRLADMKSLNPPTGSALRMAQAGQYLRNALLYSRIAYPATNAVSNVAQSALVAGTGPSSYVHAKGIDDDLIPARVQDTGGAAVNFDAPGASSLRNAIADRGSTIGGVGRVIAHPFARYAQGIFHASVEMENWTRRATYLSKAIPEAQRLAHPEWGPIHRAIASWKPADAAVKQVLSDMANGRNAEAHAAAQRSVKVLNQALGDFSAMGNHRNLSVVVPFWRWTNFVRILMGHTLPIHYPGRALLLYRLGALGQEAQHQMGNLTPSLQGAIPFGGGAISTQRINPFATLGMDVMPAQGQTALDPTRSISNISPFAQIAYETLAHKDPVTGTELTNRLGLPVQGTDYARLFGSQAVGLVAPVRAIAPLFGGGQVNAPPTSIDLPFLTQQGPRRAGPQQPTQAGWQNALNQVLPVSYRKADLALMAKQGAKKLHASLRHASTVTRKDAIEQIAASIAHQHGIDTTDRNTAAFQRVLQQAIDQYERGSH